MSAIFNFRNYHFRYLNIRLLIYVAIVCYMGILFLSSATAADATTSRVDHQLMGIAASSAVLIVVALVDYHFLFKIAIPIYCACLGMLLAVRLWGANYNNAVRWIEITSSISVQPSEFCKPGLVLFFAAYFSYWSEKGKINNVFTVIGSTFFLVFPVYLIYKQPDLSTTMVMLFLFVIIIYTAKISYKWILGVLGAAAPFAIYAYYMISNQAALILQGIEPEDGLISNYQVRRILSWLYPERFTDIVYQSENSIMAIGSGGLNGKGLFNTTLESVKNGNFLVEQDTDFIFAVIGEETGFIGSVAMVALLFLIIVECVYVGIRAKDLGGRLICIGVAGVLAFQSFVNIGVATGLLPNTGIPLPFISAGLSSLVSSFISIGLVINVGLQRERKQ